MTDEPAERPGPQPEDPPPILGSWPRLYAALVLALVLQCALFAWLTEWAS